MAESIQFFIPFDGMKETKRFSNTRGGYEMSKYKMKNRFVSMALAMLMLVTGVMPTSAFAQEMPTSETVPAVTESVESTPVESEKVTPSSNEEVSPSNETTATEEAVGETAPKVEVTTEETSVPEEEGISEPVSKPVETTSSEEITPVEEQSVAPKSTEDLAQPMEVTEPTNENETPGDKPGTVTSSDGFTRITDFEVSWSGTSDDTILEKSLARSQGFQEYYTLERKAKSMQVNWAISGERYYTPGMLRLTFNNKMSLESDEFESPRHYYYTAQYPVPEAVLNDDGTIKNNDPSYGVASFVWIDNGDNTSSIVNIVDLAPANSGTYTINYEKAGSGQGNVFDVSRAEQNIIDMKKVAVDPKIEVILENDEVLTRNDDNLYLQVDTTSVVGIKKDTMTLESVGMGTSSSLAEWNNEWSENIRPNNYQDYKYIEYRIMADNGGSNQPTTLYFKENIGPNQEIIGFRSTDSTSYAPYRTDENGYVLVSEPKQQGESYSNYAPSEKTFYILAKVEKAFLETLPDRYTFRNEITVLKVPKNSDDPSTTSSATAVATHRLPPPKAEFQAPTGNIFRLDKYKARSNDQIRSSQSPYDQQGPQDERTNHKMQFGLEGSGDLLYRAYDKTLGDRGDLESYNNPTPYIFELVDDYYYLTTDQKRELTAEDFNITSIDVGYITERKYVYKEEYNEYDYVSTNHRTDTVENVELYGKKSALGDWELLATFDWGGPNTKNFDRTVNFNPVVEGVHVSTQTNDRPRYSNYTRIKIPTGYVGTKLSLETTAHALRMTYYPNGELNINSEYVKQEMKKSESEMYEYDLMVRNDGTLHVTENSNILGIKGTSKRTEANSRTLDMDLEQYGAEMYHSQDSYGVRRIKPKEVEINHNLRKSMNNSRNETANQQFIVPTTVAFTRNIKNVYENNLNTDDFILEHEEGVFYDLLPLGVTGIENINVVGSEPRGDGGATYVYRDKTNKGRILNSSYELIPNWGGLGRMMLIVRYENAEVVKATEFNLVSPRYENNYSYSLSLNYNMIYPWDSYKDFGSRLVNHVAFVGSNPEDQLGNKSLEEYHNKIKEDTDPQYWNNYIFDNYASDLMANLGIESTKSNLYYAKRDHYVAGTTIANTGLTKHVKDSLNPSFVMHTETKENGNYSYRIRMQTIRGTTADDLIFYDSLENYNPLPTDPDYGAERWRGTFNNIDLSHPIMRGVNPIVYYSIVPGLTIQDNQDLTNSSVWSTTEPTDKSTISAIAVDLRMNQDGTPFKLGEEESIQVVVNMKAPFVSEELIGNKALNEIYANTTATTVLDDVSENKLINTAYTSVVLNPAIAEAMIRVNKEYLNNLGEEITLEGEEFTFELKDAEGNVLQTKTNAADGSVTFDPISYNSWEEGDYTYTVNEVKADNSSIAYDTNIETIQVSTKRDEYGAFRATVTYDEDGATFTNRLVEDTTAKIEANKTYFGRGGLEEQPEAEAFEFILKDAEGTEVGRAKNDAESKILFDEITFNASQIGEHKYTIEEVQGADPKIQYDEHIENVTINVSLDENFKLVAEVVYDADGAVFKNRLKTTSLQLVKLSEGTEEFELEEITNEDGVVTGYKVPEDKLSDTLDGAVYELYKVDGEEETLAGTLTTENGISNIVEDLLAGTYKLVEVTAPDGHYISDEDMTFEITEADAGTVIAKFATDEGLEDLPSTGGRGTKALMATGGVLIVVMGSLLYVANKKRRRAQ